MIWRTGAQLQAAAAGFGGISFMLLALFCTGLLVAMTFPTAMGLMSIQLHLSEGLSWQVGFQSAYDLHGIWPFAGWIGANLFALLIYTLSINLGAKRLDSVLSQDIKVEG